MKNVPAVLGLIAAALVVGYSLFLSVLASRSRRAPRLEARDGLLKACARSGNCVNTQNAAGGVLPLRFSGSEEAAWQRLRDAVVELPRTQILVEAESYLRAESRSRFFGFRDDLEALLDGKSGLIHLRSASRIGLRDRGVNRRRIERLRREFDGR